MKTFAESLAELRQLNGLTRHALAKKIGCSHSSIADWEKSEQVPNLIALVKLADFFNVSLDYLVGRGK
jgi:transcriptional regulator with XRE-family HTH domain